MHCIKYQIILTVTRILELSFTSSQRRPSVRAVTAFFVAAYICNILELWGKPWPAILNKPNMLQPITYGYGTVACHKFLFVGNVSKAFIVSIFLIKFLSMIYKYLTLRHPIFSKIKTFLFIFEEGKLNPQTTVLTTALSWNFPRCFNQSEYEVTHKFVADANVWNKWSSASTHL